MADSDSTLVRERLSKRPRRGEKISTVTSSREAEQHVLHELRGLHPEKVLYARDLRAKAEGTSFSLDEIRRQRDRKRATFWNQLRVCDPKRNSLVRSDCSTVYYSECDKRWVFRSIKGSITHTLGYSREGRRCLHPEEVLFLIDRNAAVVCLMNAAETEVTKVLSKSESWIYVCERHPDASSYMAVLYFRRNALIVRPAICDRDHSFVEIPRQSRNYWPPVVCTPSAVDAEALCHLFRPRKRNEHPQLSENSRTDMSQETDLLTMESETSCDCRPETSVSALRTHLVKYEVQPGCLQVFRDRKHFKSEGGIRAIAPPTCGYVRTICAESTATIEPTRLASLVSSSFLSPSPSTTTTNPTRVPDIPAERPVYIVVVDRAGNTVPLHLEF